ncbi:MAG: RNA polymerase sigma factor [Saprospiraceae bacterium]|nr:RNA polymerase sigma factor [Saprospiraceae bacterium]
MTKTEFSRHYRKEHTNLFGFALKLTRSSADAKDLMQDAAIKALKNCESFRDPAKFKSWFSTILYNTFINKYRRQSRRRNLLDGQKDVSGLFFNRTKAINKGYEDLKKQDIEALMQLLSAANCRAFKLYETGYSYKEISEMQDVPIGTVKSRIFFVRNKMKNILVAADLYAAA